MLVGLEDQGKKTLAETVSDLVLAQLEVESRVVSSDLSLEESSKFERYSTVFNIQLVKLYGKSHEEIIEYITGNFLSWGSISLVRRIDKRWKAVEFYIPPIENVLNAVFTNEEISTDTLDKETASILEITMCCREWK